MKKFFITTIALLVLTILFLALYSFGILNFGALTRTDGFDFYADYRRKAVKDCPIWNIGVLGNVGDHSYIVDFAQGVARAALMLNIEGGIFGKKVRLIFDEPIDGYAENRLAVQQFAQKADIACLVGPVSTSRTKEVRSLAQYFALPAIAPFSPALDELSYLEPDIFGALYPTKLLLKPLVEKLKEMQCDNLVLISGEPDSYSAIFTNLLTERLRKDPFFKEIHRIDFLPPATSASFYQPLKNLVDNAQLDAIIFADTPYNLRAFGRAMQDLKLKLPVFGNSLLAVSNLNHYTKGLDFPLFCTALQGNILPNKVFERYTSLFQRFPGIKEQFGILSLLLIREALVLEGGYDPKNFGTTLKRLATNHFADRKHSMGLAIIDVTPNKEGDATDEGK